MIWCALDNWQTVQLPTAQEDKSVWRLGIFKSQTSFDPLGFVHLFGKCNFNFLCLLGYQVGPTERAETTSSSKPCHHTDHVLLPETGAGGEEKI
jgi:hypothetical protein